MEQNKNFINDLFNKIAIKKRDKKYRQSLRNEKNILTK